MAKKFFLWLVIFLAISLIFQSYQGSSDSSEDRKEDFVLQPSESSYYLGDPVILSVTNSLDTVSTVSSDCPSEPFLVERYENGVWSAVSSKTGRYVRCEDSETPLTDEPVFHQPKIFEFRAKSTSSIDYSPWNQELFDRLGKYRVTLSLFVGGLLKTFTTEFEIVERGFFSSVMYDAFYRPIFNFLLYLTSILPNYNFGIAIIVLTIIIRLILLVPSQKALKSQKAMQKIQPELEAIKQKFKGDQQRISLETMELWKKHRVNPIGGCLPLLIQLPILIALFYVIRSGFTPYESAVVYDVLKSVDLTKVNTDFFSILDLKQVNITWLPVLVGLLQFLQMKMTFSRISSNKPAVIDPASPDAILQNPLQTMNKTMMYFLPLMIVLMVASLPSGVGLYMIVSTLFSIGQQAVVNRSQPN